MLSNLTDNLLYLLALLGQVFIVLMVVYLSFFSKRLKRLREFITRNTFPLAFIIALIATGSSLYYSQIAGFAPCDLCWLQRIFMYPQVVLLGLAWWKKEGHIIDYSLVLLFIGLAFSLYHNYIYYAAQAATFCSISAPCTQAYTNGFGYITIPLMSLTAFILIGLLLMNKKWASRLRKII